MKCKKLFIKSDRFERPSVFYGIILEENNRFIVFKTAKKEYTFSREIILRIDDANFRFVEAGD